MDVEEQLANISLKEEKVSHDIFAGKRADDAASSICTASIDSKADGDSESEAKQRFMKLVAKARQLAEKGDISRALVLNEKALAISYSDKLQRRIQKMKAFLAEQDASDDEDEGQMKCLGQGFMLHRRLYDKIYTHQKEGVLWMWSLFLLRKGGILADDMGLGKTIQVIAFLAGMFDMQKIKSVMIVVPLSVLPNWLNEFNKWTPGINVMQFHGSSRKEKERALARVRTRGGVLMTTYGLVVTTKEVFAERHGQQFVWDYVILDEGHKIKNQTKTAKSVHQIPAKHRIILTGTPVQNNLKELWSLFDYVHQGLLLGTMRTFKMEFETPIIRARERDATNVEKKLGQEMAEILKSIIKPYFLRRTKAEVSNKNETLQSDSAGLRMPSMTRKNDLVIWLHLTEIQQKIYQDFLDLDQVKELLMTKKSPLVSLTVLKKICDHPRLLSTRACLQLGLDGEDFDEEALEDPGSYESAVNQIDKIPDEILVNEAGKMQILVQLLDNFKSEGHKTLVFSQSRKLLNIVQKVITNRGHKVARLDGTITQLAEREEIVQKFQKDPSYSVFLLTVQVGGVGLTITAADRVIIYDPNWNPATDAQAVDRAYRIGQNKNVVVYRLITCGTVEEKIYRRQVFKDSITRQTTGNTKNPYRYFTKMELRELFTLDDPRFSKTQRQLQDLHGEQRQSDTALDEHIAYLHSLDIFGISDHDLMFRQTQFRDDEEDDILIRGEQEEQNNERLIQQRIQQAQMLITNESAVPSTYEERSKGLMRFPSSVTTFTVSGSGIHASQTTNVPAPSPLFTQVSASGNDESESTNEAQEYDEDDDVQEVVDLTSAMNDSLQVKDISDKMSSPSSKLPKSNTTFPVKQEPKRLALQPLTAEEVRQRSPQFTSGRNKSIISEEILISPDSRSPLIGLEKVQAQHRMLEGASGHGSPNYPSSPLRCGISSPKSGFGKRITSSPKLSGSPASSPSKNTFFRSPMVSPRRSTKENHSRKSLFPLGSASTPQVSCDTEILVAESPDRGPRTPPSSSRTSSTNASPRLSTPLDVSGACRKLSFVVADSVNNSPADCPQNLTKSAEASPCPVARKKHRVLSSSESPSASPSADSDASLRAQGDEQSLSRLDRIREKSKAFHAALNESSENFRKHVSPTSSPRHILGTLSSEGSSARKTVSNKRRSVCLHQPAISDESSENDSDSRNEDKQASSENDENNENEMVDDIREGEEDENDEEDKENDPVWMKQGMGRDRSISCSESEGDSCYEVEESEEEDVAGQSEPEEENMAEAGIENQDNKEAATLEVTDDVEEEDDDKSDEELNERFQQLVRKGRELYKHKNYEDSLWHVEEALKIFDVPQLAEMCDKIRLKVQSQSQQ